MQCRNCFLTCITIQNNMLKNNALFLRSVAFNDLAACMCVIGLANCFANDPTQEFYLS
jgi:hypothetical protein